MEVAKASCDLLENCVTDSDLRLKETAFTCQRKLGPQRLLQILLHRLAGCLQLALPWHMALSCGYQKSVHFGYRILTRKKSGFSSRVGSKVRIAIPSCPGIRWKFCGTTGGKIALAARMDCFSWVEESIAHCYITGTDRLYRCYLRELNFLLCLSHFEQPLLPSVIGLLADTVFFALDLDVLTAVTALRDSPGPQSQFVLRISCL